jgi:glycyl-tRNA synthetase
MLKQVKIDLDSKLKAYSDATGKSSSSNKEAFRAALVNVLERRLFFIPSFKIYGAVAGFYDYGPPGCAIKQNITQIWRQHFILEESMLEVECPVVTPEPVLRASGHVERFTDFMVTDIVTGEPLRADHLLENALEALLEDTKNPPTKEAAAEARETLARVGELGSEELGAALSKYNIKSPDTGNDISAPFPFNLMFKTSIGPRGDMVGYLRPETAQGIFVNFRDLLFYNGGKLPFAAAQIGSSYRNEISPRAGLLRVREFTQAEIEHFCNPNDKSHPKFKTVADVKPLIYSRALQLGAEKKPAPMSLGDAVSQGIIANQTLAYFIGRTHQFCCKIGLNPSRVRFRQHLQHEMAHYAEDCWDCEVETSYGWVECAGLADRSAYDLNAHSTASKVELAAYERFDEPRMEEVVTIVPNKKELGKILKKDAQRVADELLSMSDSDALAMKAGLEAGNKVPLKVHDLSVEIEPSWVEITPEMKKTSGRNFTPAVIEPSFGIGRLLYCIFEHCYYTRENDERRAVLKFTPLAAPVKATVFPLMAKPDLVACAEKVATALTRAGLSNAIDSTGQTIGKRYARTDEIGVPFAVTVDFDSLEDGTATLRDRDSTAQVRVPLEEMPGLLRKLTDMEETWENVAATYPAQAPIQEDDE